MVRSRYLIEFFIIVNTHNKFHLLGLYQTMDCMCSKSWNLFILLRNYSLDCFRVEMSNKKHTDKSDGHITQFCMLNYLIYSAFHKPCLAPSFLICFYPVFIPLRLSLKLVTSEIIANSR